MKYMSKDVGGWCGYFLNTSNRLHKNYHDEEWGFPIHNDIKHFEYLLLESMQCGLSWSIILNKREILRKCFKNFDFRKIANFTEKDINNILNTELMIKSQKKIEAMINNAKCFIEICKEYGTFDKYIWSFSKNKVLVYKSHSEDKIPANNKLSDMIAKELKKKGFKFLGTTTVYAYLQAIGIINDHHKNCQCYKSIVKNYDFEYVIDD